MGHDARPTHSLTQSLTQSLTMMKVLYFIFFAGNGIFFTYITVYYVGFGLTGMQIGLISTLAPLAGVFGMTLCGILNDRFGRTRLLLMATIAGSTLASLAIPLMPTFAALTAAGVAYSFFLNPIIPLIDSTTLSLLAEHREDYGRVRVWGSVGFIISTAGLGLIMQRASIVWMFPAFALIWLCLLFGATRLPVQRVSIGGFTLRGLGQMVGQRAWVIFIISVFLLGLAFSGLFNFLSVSMRVAGASASLIGLASTVSAISEIPIMFSGSALIKRFGSARIVALSYALFAARAFLYSAMPAPVWAVPINALFGSAFGLYWIGAVSHTSELAPPGLRTTSQSLLSSTISLAVMGGAFVSGWLFDTAGAVGLFRVLTVCCLTALTILSLGHILLQRGATLAEQETT